MSAAVNGGALVYLGFTGHGLDQAGWYPIGGTSEASPMFSGVVAIADEAAGHDLGLLNPTLYAHGDGPSSGLVDITKANNSVTFPQGGKTITVNGFNAVPGYDLERPGDTGWCPPGLRAGRPRTALIEPALSA
jgi:subtilase family serine protease